MLNFVFWNTKGKGKQRSGGPTAALIAELAENCDVLIIAEPVCKSEAIAEKLSELSGREYRSCVGPAGMTESSENHRLQIVTNLGTMIQPLQELGRVYAYRIVTPSIGFVLAALHLESSAFSELPSQRVAAGTALEKILGYEADQGLPALVVGDFNLNPYDSVLSGAETGAFHAVSCSTLAGSGPRRSEGKQYQYFYNPSWSLFGDAEGSPGTYFYKGLGSVYWQVLDQVIMRPALRNNFVKGSLKTVTHVGARKLTDKLGRPKVSDHLPIKFSLDDLKERSDGSVARNNR